MAEEEDRTFMIEDAQIIFRNFSGREGPYNRSGVRNFAVKLSPEDAAGLSADGWNVKVLQPKEEGDEEQPFIKITVSYKRKPPRIVLLTEKARTNLDEGTLEVLDWADIEHVDLIARAYEWDFNGKQGRSAYLKSLFVKIKEDALERKYGVNDNHVEI